MLYTTTYIPLLLKKSNGKAEKQNGPKIANW